MTYRYIKQSTAYSTTELLVCMFISLSLIAGLTRGLHQFLVTDARLRIESHETFVYIRLRNLISEVLADLDSHRFEILPRIHKNGAISFTDNTLNPVTSLQGSNAPHPESDAITGLRLESTRSYRVLESSRHASQFRYLACPEVNLQDRTSAKSYMGVSSDGLLELSGSSTASGSCRIFLLGASLSMSVKQDHVDPLFIRKLIPISRHYTIYVGKDLQLRYLSHVGSRNIENQPMMSASGVLEFLQESIAKNKVTSITTRIRMSGDRQKEFMNVNNLGRIRHFNYLFNELESNK